MSNPFRVREEVYVNATGGFKNAKGKITQTMGDYGAVVTFPWLSKIEGSFRFHVDEISREPVIPPVTEKQLERARQSMERAIEKHKALAARYEREKGSVE